jgi:hypothetical protein
MDVVALEEAVKPIASILSNIDQKVYVAKFNYVDRQDGLTADMSAAIMIYTMGSSSDDKSLYHVLNSILRSDEPNRSDQLKSWFLYLKLFITALSHLPSYRGTIYRGVKNNLSDFYTINKTFVWWGFSSCTKSINVLQSNLFLGNKGAGTLFIIDCFSGKDIGQHSHYPKEDEVLLVAARQFEVVGRLNLASDLWVIHIKETKPPFPFLETDNSISSTFEIVSPDKTNGSPSTNKCSKCLKTISNLLTSDAQTTTDDIICNVQVEAEIVTHQDLEEMLPIENLTSDPVQSTSSDVTLVNSVENIDEAINSESSKMISSSLPSCTSAKMGDKQSSKEKLINSGVEENSLTSMSINKHTTIPNNSERKTISFQNMLITTESIGVILENIRENIQLEILHFVSNYLGDEMLHDIIQALVGRSLLRVFIINNRITDVGAMSIAKLLCSAPRTLYLLHLENNLITDQGVKSVINALPRHPDSTLKSLSFSRNRLVEDGCIDDIIDVLNGNHSLRSLYLDKCNLSEDGKQRLQHAFGKKAAFSLHV